MELNNSKKFGLSLLVKNKAMMAKSTVRIKASIFENAEDGDGDEKEDGDEEKDKKKRLWNCAVQDCSSSFKRRHDLFRHEKLHEGSKPFKCSFCPKR